MRVHLELAEPHESLIATGKDFAHTADLGSWDNHGTVVCPPPLQGGVAARRGRRLIVWIEDRPAR
jgi:hypothetical protein